MVVPFASPVSVQPRVVTGTFVTLASTSSLLQLQSAVAIYGISIIIEI
jgi:hypothetical protein